MKFRNLNVIDVDATHEYISQQNEKIRRIREERERKMAYKESLPEQYVVDEDEKDEEAELDDLYREEENRRTVEEPES